MRLTGVQRREFVQAIQQAFDSDTLRTFLYVELGGLRLDDHVRATGFADQAADFVRFLEASPRMGDFLRAAANSQNVHPDFRAFATRLLDSSSPRPVRAPIGPDPEPLPAKPSKLIVKLASALVALLVLLVVLILGVPVLMKHYAMSALSDDHVGISWDNDLNGYELDFSSPKGGALARVHGWLRWLRPIRAVRIDAALNNIGQLYDVIELGEVRELQISGKDALRMLPKSWEELSMLTQLTISFNDILQALPVSWEGLASLMELNIDHNSRLQTLPNSWEGLASLTQLKISDNASLEALAMSWEGLSQLTQLRMFNNASLEALPKSWEGLGSLRHLQISGNASLKALPKSWEGLKLLRRLEIYDNPNLAALPPLSGLAKLDEARLSGQFLDDLLRQVKDLPTLSHVMLPDDEHWRSFELSVNAERTRLGFELISFRFEKPGAVAWWKDW